MNKIFLNIVGILIIPFALKAQQEPMFNQYQFAPVIYNPSFVGVSDGIDVALFRNQKWGNYEEGFIANQLTVGTSIKDNHGIGINLYSDYVGITSKLKAYLQYSYRIKFNEDMGLRAGVGLGVVDNRIDFASAVVNDPNDPLFSNIAKDRRTMFDMNVGINFYYKTLRVGFASPQVLGTKLVYGDQNGFYTLERQMVGSVGYIWQISEEKGLLLYPEALVMYTPNAPFNYNVNLIFEMEKYFWVGAGYKSDYAVSASLGINLIKNLKFGVSYDIQLMPIANYNSAPNAELMLRYSIPPKIQEVENNEEWEKIIAEQQRQMDSLNNVIRTNEGTIDGLEDENQVLKDSLAKWPKDLGQQTHEIDTLTNEMVTNSDDHFVELSGKETPNGYYVITGAFAEKSNADRLVRKIKGKFPNARIIMNERNNLYYVILYHSTEKGEGLAYASYKAKNGMEEETWILHYNR